MKGEPGGNTYRLKEVSSQDGLVNRVKTYNLFSVKQKKSAYNSGDWVRSLGWEDPLEKGNGYPFQYSGLENSMNREALWPQSMGPQRVEHN